MSEKLLPCPFCGSAAGIAGDGTSWEVGCSADECYVSMFDINRERAIATWNKRTTDSLPTYYVLRRTVGKTMMHYEYDCVYDGWVLNQHYASLHGEKQFAETRASKIGPCEIIPVKLVEVPHES